MRRSEPHLDGAAARPARHGARIAPPRRPRPASRPSFRSRAPPIRPRRGRPRARVARAGAPRDRERPQGSPGAAPRRRPSIQSGDVRRAELACARARPPRRRVGRARAGAARPDEIGPRLPAGTDRRDRARRRRDRCGAPGGPPPNDARAPRRMSRSAISAAAKLAAAPTPRASPSTTSRARRGWTGSRAMRRPTSVSRPSRSTPPSRPSSSRAAPHAAAGGGIQPRERVGVAHAERRQRQRDLRQIARARSRAPSRGRALLEIVARVEAQRASGTRASGAPGPLRRGRLADLRRAPASAAPSTASAPRSAPGPNRSPRSRLRSSPTTRRRSWTG